MRARAQITAGSGLFAHTTGFEFAGYEIHMGQTERAASATALVEITSRSEEPTAEADGAISAGGWVAGVYLHGLFDDDRLRHAILRNLAVRRTS